MALSVVYFQLMHRLGRHITCGTSVRWWWKEGRRWNPVLAHRLLFSKSTKGAAMINVPIRWTNQYQQYAFSTYILADSKCRMTTMSSYILKGNGQKRLILTILWFFYCVFYTLKTEIIQHFNSTDLLLSKIIVTILWFFYCVFYTITLHRIQNSNSIVLLVFEI